MHLYFAFLVVGLSSYIFLISFVCALVKIEL